MFTALTEEYKPYEGEKSSKHLSAYEKDATDLLILRQCFANTALNRTNNVMYQDLYSQIQHYS